MFESSTYQGAVTRARVSLCAGFVHTLTRLPRDSNGTQCRKNSCCQEIEKEVEKENRKALSLLFFFFGKKGRKNGKRRVLNEPKSPRNTSCQASRLARYATSQPATAQDPNPKAVCVVSAAQDGCLCCVGCSGRLFVLCRLLLCNVAVNTTWRGPPRTRSSTSRHMQILALWWCRDRFIRHRQLITL